MFKIVLGWTVFWICLFLSLLFNDYFQIGGVVSIFYLQEELFDTPLF